MTRFGLLLKPFLDLCFPPICAACRKRSAGAAFLCDACASATLYISSPLCPRCGAIFTAAGGGDHLCGECLQKVPPFSYARAVAQYAPPVSTLLHRLKYGTDRTVLAAVSRLVVPFDFRTFAACDLIVPVPLHPRRLKARGLNQSLILAHIFFPQQSNHIHPEVLVRTRNTPPQTRLDGKERRRNLRGAFAMARKVNIDGKVICLVDDVLTTGTTVCECAETLLRAGAKDVMVITMARVVERI